jgi:hypothetical protein
MLELLDVPMRMKYYFKGRVVDIGAARFDEKWYTSWLNSMVNEHTNIIFFLVTETTDVFEKEWDFNDYSYPTLFSYTEDCSEPIQSALDKE